MRNPVWHSGPPPSLGWWPASTDENRDVYRWWNGKYWSRFVGRDAPMAAVGRAASNPAYGFGGIRWTDRPASWPERSKT